MQESTLTPNLKESVMGPGMKESVIATRLERSALREDDGFRESRYGGGEWQRGSRSEEEAFFSKVREMKDSLIHQERSRGPSTRSYLMPKQPHHGEGRKECEPRIENIDRINNKIKQILTCLNDNEKTNPAAQMMSSEHERRPETPVPRSSKIRDASSSKQSYESHFQKQSDVL